MVGGTVSSRSLERDRDRRPSERVPFYRNVKTLATLAQVFFVVVALAAIYIVYRNISTGLASSGLTFGFGFLDDRAGFDLGETAIQFSASDSYFRAIVVGFLNTLKVGLAGVVLCSILGVSVGVMRLSGNWLIRMIATVYVELLRNTPLAVQLIFWYFAVILTLPPRSDNAVRLPGDIYLSQIGIGLPWFFPTYNFWSWVPWLAAALVVGGVVHYLRGRQLRRADRPGNRWLAPVAAALVVAAVGYVVADARTGVAEGIAADVNATRGIGTVYIDENGNGERDLGEEYVPFAPVIVGVEDARLETTSRNIVESREAVYSTFRFPLISEGEYESFDVSFDDPAAAEDLSIHLMRPPSVGLIYRDQNGNGEYDEGEERYVEDGFYQGYNGVRVVMELQGFERRLVSDRSGTVRLPIFEPPPVEEGAEDAAAPGGGGGGGGLGALFQQQEQTGERLVVTTELPPPGPLAYSEPTVPRSSYFGGTRLTTPFLALLLGLAIYTSAFVAEIVRAGIQAVPRGQPEAAKALGLSGNQTFSLVVFPQALRIIIPPVISQYLNLTKNSSLAILVTFSDFFQVSNTVGNQTGQFVSVYVIILIGYILLSIVFSVILNIVNARLALVER